MCYRRMMNPNMYELWFMDPWTTHELDDSPVLKIYAFSLFAYISFYNYQLHAEQTSYTN